MAKQDINMIDEDEDIIEEDAPIADATETDPDIVDEDLDIAPEDALPTRAVRNADGSVTLSLKYPRTIKSKKAGKVRETLYDKLVLHRLNGTDMRLIQAASDAMVSAVALARMARMNTAVANRLTEVMDVSDLNAVGQVLANFSSTGRKTGKSG